MLRDLFFRVRAILRRDRMEADLQEELRAHLEYEKEKYLRSGIPEQEASRRARLVFGGVDQVMEECRDSRGISTVTAISQDIRYGIRVLRKSPAFTCVAIISLALGIGVNTVAFSVVNALILRPLPLPHPDRLVSVHPIRGATTSFPNYRALRDMNNVFRGLAAYRITVVGLEIGGASQRVWAYLATGNYFETLGATPLLGRFFGPNEDRHRGGSAYAVLSYNCWRNRFGGDPGIVGRTLRLNGLTYTIVGVAGKSFQGTEIFYWPEIWIPMSMQAQIESFPWLDDPASFDTMMVGRLKGGITQENAQAQLQPIAAALARENPRWNDGLQFKLSPLGLIGDTFRGPVIGFTAGVLLLAGLVLVAACANLASLLAARTTDRHKELAVRMSLGAGRGRIAGQLMTESVLVALAGGFSAWVLSIVLLKLLSQWHAPLDFPVQFNVEPDWTVFLFTCLVSTVTGFLFGIVPARQALRTDPNPALKGSLAGTAQKWSLRDLLLPVQVALCSLLVMGTMVSLRGLQRASALPLGFNPSGVAVVGFDLSLSGKRLQGQAFQRAALDRISQIPGVKLSAYANSVPLSIDQSSNAVVGEEVTDFRPSARISVSIYEVSPGYFRTMGTPLLGGREFSWQDEEKGQRVAIINETLARRLFGRSDVVGRHFRGGGSGGLTEIVGVAQDGKYTSLTETPQPALFRTATQVYNSETILIARTSGSEGQIAAEMRSAVAEMDHSIAFHGVGSLNQLLGFAYFPARAATIALSAFGLLAIMLAATGIYGVAAYAVSRRCREIGIRVAMGAQSRQILETLLGRTSVLLLVGSIAGFLLGLAAGPLLASVVYQASPTDPFVMATVPVAMACLALVSVLGPARRALRIDPAYTLRQD